MPNKVELKDLDSKEEFVEFLRQKIQGDVSIEGDLVVIDSKFSVKRIKTYLKRFLHREGLRKKFKIRCSQGKITLLKEKEVKEE